MVVAVGQDDIVDLPQTIEVATLAGGLEHLNHGAGFVAYAPRNAALTVLEQMGTSFTW